MTRLLARGALVAITASLLYAAGTASADRPERPSTADRAPHAFSYSIATRNSSATSLSAPDQQHGGDDQHLPPVRKNMELVSKLEPLSQGPVGDDQIADVAVYKNFAYLQSGWNCQAGKGGFYVIDISNPAAPREVNFTPALEDNYHGEGAHVITIDTPAFRGDVLAVNNETCGNTAANERGGGFDLYDVSNPAAPVTLVQGFGDHGGEGTLVGNRVKANEAHSIFIWDAGDRAYAVIVDNEELHDVDIFDITNPRSPQPVREYDLFDTAPDAFTDDANVGTAFHHDMVVKRIGGSFKLLASYWDAGYIQLDADDPSNLRYDADSDFGGNDPLTGFNPPEGNAHQAEYTRDDRAFVTGEEDFAPFRVEYIDIENVGRRAAAMVPGGTAPNYLPDGIMNGPAAYVGYACNRSAPVPTPQAVGMPAKGPGEEWIAVVQRGPAFDPDEDYDGDGNTSNDSDDACFPGEKAANADEAGWDAVLFVNRHTTSGAAGDGVNCGSGGFPAGAAIVSVCTTHAAFHELFNDAVTYNTPYDDSDVPATGDSNLPAEGPNIGARAPNKVTAEGLFDGWGYMSMYSTQRDENGKFPLLDAHAIKEALNPAYAFGFGDLSIHEQATDPTQPLSYSSYYSGGLRVFSFEANRITEQGAFIDEGGNDMWGVEQFTARNCERLIAGSDRDYGLYIVRYTGPFAVGPCAEASTAPPTTPPGLRPGRCANELTGTIAGERINGTPAGDIITGYDGDDVIDGGDGDDCINGLGGNDDLRGGRGVDNVEGQKGNDVVRGGPGRGTLRGGTGRDRVFGAGAKDLIHGNTGADRLRGGGQADQMFGGPGGDRIVGGRGRDTIEGGTGNDRIHARDGRRDMIDCGFGRDRVVSRDRADRMTSCERRARLR